MCQILADCAIIFSHTLLLYCEANQLILDSQKTWCLPSVVLMLGQCQRRWPNIKPTSGQCLIFTGQLHCGDVAVQIFAQDIQKFNQVQ